MYPYGIKVWPIYCGSTHQEYVEKKIVQCYVHNHNGMVTTVLYRALCVGI